MRFVRVNSEGLGAEDIDVSSWQGNIDWGKVKSSGVSGGLVKATEGISFVDSFFSRNWGALKQFGMQRGAYHFARPGQSSGRAQAEHFCRSVGEWTPNDLAILDFEDGALALDGWAIEFFTTLQINIGKNGIFYSYAPFIRAHFSKYSLASHPLWLAAYTGQKPACPPPWREIWGWQFTNAQRIPGISGNVDESHIYSPIPQPIPVPGGAVLTPEQAFAIARGQMVSDYYAINHRAPESVAAVDAWAFSYRALIMSGSGDIYGFFDGYRRSPEVFADMAADYARDHPDPHPQIVLPKGATLSPEGLVHLNLTEEAHIEITDPVA